METRRKKKKKILKVIISLTLGKLLFDGDDDAEIDPVNIVSSRTRGKRLNYAKEAQKSQAPPEEDEDDDEDFEAPQE